MSPSTASKTGYIDIARDIFLVVKAGFVYESDKSQFGVEEDWRFPTDATSVTGDCDDFAIACRMLLKAVGLDARLAFCRVDGVGHLVCVIGKVALDNRMSDLVEVQELARFHKYEFLSVSGKMPGDDWTQVLSIKEAHG